MSGSGFNGGARRSGSLVTLLDSRFLLHGSFFFLLKRLSPWPWVVSVHWVPGEAEAVVRRDRLLPLNPHRIEHQIGQISAQFGCDAYHSRLVDEVLFLKGISM